MIKNVYIWTILGWYGSCD